MKVDRENDEMERAMGRFGGALMGQRALMPPDPHLYPDPDTLTPDPHIYPDPDTLTTPTMS